MEADPTSRRAKESLRRAKESLRCAEESLRVREPLPGTAPHADRWVCVEHPSPWTAAPAQDPDPEVVRLADRARAEGWHLALVRRPGAPGSVGRRRVYLAETSPSASRLGTLQVPALDDVELDVAAGDAVPDPVLFVCGHGGRDRCCVREGRPLAAELAERGVDVWECSHLGGHRFAPTALVLPSGYAYGRLDAAAALAAVDAARAGEVELGRCRGRTTWPGPGQVAELAVRATAGIWAAGALTVEVGEPEVPRVRHVDGRTWRVELHRGTLAGHRPTDCGGEPERVVPLFAGTVEQVRE